MLVARFSLDHGQLTYVSPNVERMLGFSDAEVLAPGFLDEHIDPEDLPEATARFDRVAAESVSHASSSASTDRGRSRCGCPR